LPEIGTTLAVCIKWRSLPLAKVMVRPSLCLLYRLCRPEDLQYACVTILAMNPDSPSRRTLYHTLLDLYLQPAQQPAQQGQGAADSQADALGPGNVATQEKQQGQQQKEQQEQPAEAGNAGANAVRGAGGNEQPPAVRQQAAGRKAGADSTSSRHHEALDLLK
jgi:hypothetical protein